MNFTEIISCELVDACASDLAVVNAARISFDSEHTKLEPRDEGLIRYLMRERHGSPFEHGYFKFRVEAPIFVFREHHRHRAGHSFNEMSGRYTELEPTFYVPPRARVQEGKPGHYVYVEKDKDDPLSEKLDYLLTDAYEYAWGNYELLLSKGIAKEQARMVLPLGIYSKMVWSCNPRSLMHFLGLRTAPNAQKEIQIAATAAEKALAYKMPHTYAAFTENDRRAP
jgi:thymidylate synthase (FAD)